MPKKVSEEHDELVHYTGSDGLTGILRTQSLRATHASYLNDSEEIKMFFDRRLPTLLESDIREGLKTLSAAPGNQALIEQAGGFEGAVTEALAGMVKAIREATIAFNQPYVLSFCSSKNDHIQTNGLLSQWRGYGRDGGYAIIFDSKRLETLLEAEAARFHYQHVQIGDVHYYDGSSDNAEAAEEIQEAEAVLKSGVLAFLRGQDPEKLEPTLEAVTTLSCFYKHWGFHEEREVRVVVVPPDPAVISAASAAGVSRPLKVPQFFSRDGCPIPCLSLFERPDAAKRKAILPIKRVIIGPHREKEQRKRAIELLLAASGIDAQVSTSEIPYVGR